MEVVVDGRSYDLDERVVVVSPGDRLTSSAPLVEVDLGSPDGAPIALRDRIAEVTARARAGEVVVARLPSAGTETEAGDVPGAGAGDVGTVIAAATLAVAGGSRVLRTDDERTARRVAAVVDAIRRSRRPTPPGPDE